MTLIEERHVKAQAQNTSLEPSSDSALWKTQRKGASLAAGAIVVGLLVGFLAAMLVTARTSVYSSRAVLLMDQPGAISLAEGDGVVLKLSRLRLKYAGLVGTQAVNASVSQALHVPAAALTGQVSASAPGDNLNIVITSQTAKKANAAPLTAATATALQQYIDREQAAAKIAPNLKLRLTLIQPATAASASGSGDHRKVIVGIAAGVLAAAAVAALGLLRR
jgi:capsular polysaccharide biosynthesis protein